MSGRDQRVGRLEGADVPLKVSDAGRPAPWERPQWHAVAWPTLAFAAARWRSMAR